MRLNPSSKFIIGLALVFVVFSTELLIPAVTGAVAYVVVTLFAFRLLVHPQHITGLAVITTLLIVVGYFNATNSTFNLTTTGANLFSILLMWIGAYFVIHRKKIFYKDSKEKEQFEALFKYATEGILFSDERGAIVRMNPFACTMFGYASDELVGKKIEKLIPDRLCKQHEGYRKKFVQNPQHRSVRLNKDVYGRHKNGSEFPIELSLSHIQSKDQLIVIVFIVDITERKKASDELCRLNDELEDRINARTDELAAALTALERTNKDLEHQIERRKLTEGELVKSQRLYNAMAHNFPDGVIGVLNRQMQYVLADGMELRDLGLSAAKIPGAHLFDLHSALNQSSEKLLEKTFDGKRASFEVELQNRAYKVIAVPLPDIKSEINEILVVIRNITERKQIENSLVKALAKEKELNALKSAFVTMASHEFRTPLSTILSSVFLLENYTGLDYEKEKHIHIGRIKRTVHNLTEILNDFLSLGKLEEGKIKVTNTEIYLKDLFDEILQEADSIKKSEQEIQYAYTGEPCMVVTDRRLLKHIVINLLSNAIKYSAPDTQIRLKVFLSGNRVRIEIEDQGIGIPAEDRRNIFKRFYRAHNAVNIDGTGLGLNIVKKYVRLLKGTIDFITILNKGTTFSITIPITRVKD